MTTDTYTALVDGVDDNAPCHCDDCDWTGIASDTKDIEDCILTPGDGSPVGRCPECDTLAYVSKPTPDTVKVVKITVSGADVSGAVAYGLAKQGVWFRCAPLPGVQFEFTVKAHDAWYLPSHQSGKALHQTHFTLSELWTRPQTN
jgi:hypothetical protein